MTAGRVVWPVGCLAVLGLARIHEERRARLSPAGGSGSGIRKAGEPVEG